MYSVLIIINNTVVIYLKVAKRINLKYSYHNREIIFWRVLGGGQPDLLALIETSITRIHEGWHEFAQHEKLLVWCLRDK